MKIRDPMSLRHPVHVQRRDSSGHGWKANQHKHKLAHTHVLTNALSLIHTRTAVVTTVGRCADRWDYTHESWDGNVGGSTRASAGGSANVGGAGGGGGAAEGGKVVVIGGVRYVMEPGMNAVRTLHKPHDLLQDPRLSGACMCVCYHCMMFVAVHVLMVHIYICVCVFVFVYIYIYIYSA